MEKGTYTPPKVEPVTAWPPEVRKALMELVAFTLNQNSVQMMFEMKGLIHDGQRLPDMEITVRRLDP